MFLRCLGQCSHLSLVVPKPLSILMFMLFDMTLVFMIHFIVTREKRGDVT